jgi:prevent-host-death family protein
MIKIPTHEAKTHLSQYLARAERGETIVITRGNRPMAKLVPFEEAPQSRIPKVGDMLDEHMNIPEEAIAPMTDAEMDVWGL